MNELLTPKMLTRLRLLVGGILLFAALLTWFIGITLSPHGEAIVAGTEHVRDTVVTFKRNCAVGTLLLSAVSAWLLFPVLRPRRPVLDWPLILVVAVLAGSSIYTLLSLGPSSTNSTELGSNLASGYSNETDTSGNQPTLQPTNLNEAPVPVQIGTRPATADDLATSTGPTNSTDRVQSSDPDNPEQQDQANQSNDTGLANGEVEQNQS